MMATITTKTTIPVGTITIMTPIIVILAIVTMTVAVTSAVIRATVTQAVQAISIALIIMVMDLFATLGYAMTTTFIAVNTN